MPSTEPTATKVRDQLEGYGIDTSVLSDAWINTQRDEMVVPWVESKIRYKLGAAQQFVEFHSGNGGTILALNRRPIVTLDKLEYVNSPILTSVLDVSSIQVIANEGMLKARTNFSETQVLPIFSRGTNNIKITYTAGNATDPPNLINGIKYLLSEKALGQIANRTGGGNLSVQGFSRSYGNRGKWTNIRNELARDGMALIKPFMTSMIGA